MSQIIKISLAILGLTLCAAVLLHSLHVTQLLGIATADARMDSKKIAHDDVRPDLHNHHDKQTVSSLFKTFNGDPANLVDRSRAARRRRNNRPPFDWDWLRDMLHLRQHGFLS